MRLGTTLRDSWLWPGVMAAVGQQPFGPEKLIKQGGGASVIAHLTCRHAEADRATIRIRYGMKPGVHTAFRASALGGAPILAGPGHGVLVVSSDGGDTGMPVDAVSGIVMAQDRDMRETPDACDDAERGKVAGFIRCGDRLIAILDPIALLPHSADRAVVTPNTWNQETTYGSAA
jgi:hypothetical protein